MTVGGVGVSCLRADDSATGTIGQIPSNQITNIAVGVVVSIIVDSAVPRVVAIGELAQRRVIGRVL